MRWRGILIKQIVWLYVELKTRGYLARLFTKVLQAECFLKLNFYRLIWVKGLLQIHANIVAFHECYKLVLEHLRNQSLISRRHLLWYLLGVLSVHYSFFGILSFWLACSSYIFYNYITLSSAIFPEDVESGMH